MLLGLTGAGALRSLAEKRMEKRVRSPWTNTRGDSPFLGWEVTVGGGGGGTQTAFTAPLNRPMKAVMRACRVQFMCHMQSVGQGQAVYCSDVLPQSRTSSLSRRGGGGIWGECCATSSTPLEQAGRKV